MADQPVQILTPAETLAEQVIRDLLFNVALKAALQAIETNLPWLRLPIINPIFEFLAKQFVGLIWGQLSQVVTFDIVDIRIVAEKMAYTNAVASLKAAFVKGDESGITQAKIDFEKRLADLIHFSPTH